VARLDHCRSAILVTAQVLLRLGARKMSERDGRERRTPDQPALQPARNGPRQSQGPEFEHIPELLQCLVESFELEVHLSVTHLTPPCSVLCSARGRSARGRISTEMVSGRLALHP
jgi:hypothetical protein